MKSLGESIFRNSLLEIYRLSGGYTWFIYNQFIEVTGQNNVVSGWVRNSIEERGKGDLCNHW